MRFTLDLDEAGIFFFDTLPDLTNALQIANVFKPFVENVEYNIMAIEGGSFVDLVIKGIQFTGTDMISFGLSDDSRPIYEEFKKKHSVSV